MLNKLDNPKKVDSKESDTSKFKLNEDQSNNISPNDLLSSPFEMLTSLSVSSTDTTVSSLSSLSSSSENQLKINNQTNPLPKLFKTHSLSNASTSNFPVHNRLMDQENDLLNKTFTMGTRICPPCCPPRRGRSSSIDSDFGDYTIHGAITGLFPRSIGSGIKYTSNHISRKTLSQNNHSTTKQQRKFAKNITLWTTCAKLPSLEGYSADRKCCIKPFVSTRTQFELAKYKEALKNS